MWSYDDIIRRNPPGEGQRSSILVRLLQTHSATRELLCETSDELDDRGEPFVCYFGQLSFPLSLQSASYTIRGSAPGISLHLDFRLFKTGVNSTGEVEFAYITPEQARESKNTGPVGTQVRAFLPVWGLRLGYYKNYLECLHDDGLDNRIIGATAWDPATAPAAYKGSVVRAHAFEAELASRIAIELEYVLRKFQIAYSLVSLEELPATNIFYGGFLLVAPGRVTHSKPPEPVLTGMLSRLDLPAAVKKNRIEQTLQFGFREIDRYLHQILAMHRLSKQGEPGLAIIGCVTAIEWFMNSFVKQKEERSQSKRKEEWSLSLKDCVREPPFSSFPEDLRRRLILIADIRNDIVHGEPPSRQRHSEPRAEKESLSSIAEVVRIGVDLYREVNLRRLKPSVKQKC